MLVPRCADSFDACSPNSRDLREPVRFLIQDPQAVEPEVRHDALSSAKTDPADDSARQVTLEPFERIGGDGDETLDLEALAVTRIVFDTTGNADTRTRSDRRHDAHRGE